MTPRVAVAITANNQTRPAFGEVVKDANVAAGQIEAASSRAARSTMGHNSAIAMLGKSSANAANQQRNLAFQLNDVAVSLASGANPLMVFAQQGSQIATIYGPSEGGLGRALKETGNMAVGLVTKFWPVAAAVGLGTAAVAGMTAEINKAGGQQVSFGDVAMATWQVFADGVYNLVQPAIGAVSGWIGDMWTAAWPVIHEAGNAIIATFVGAFDASKEVWQVFPAVMGDFVITAVNNVIGGVESLINGSIGLMNDFKTSLGMEGDLGTVKFSGVENPFEGAMAGIGGKVAGAFQNAFGVDYLGNAFEAIKSRAQALAAAAEEAGKAGKGAAKDIEPLNLGLEAANDNAAKLGETLAGQLTSGVMSIWQAFRSGGNVLEAISNQLMNFADQLLGNAVQSFFSSILGGGFGGGVSSFVGNGFGSYGKWANGGDFTVAGSGPTDSQMVSFMATPGEQVSIRTPGQAANGNAGGGYIAVDVQVGVQNGNIVPLMVRVAGEVAGQKIKQESGAAVAVQQRNRI